jgi:hypothetical protein
MFSMLQIRQNAKLLLALQYKKGHQGSNLSGHSFVFLNVNINNMPVFFSEVVTYKKSPRSEDKPFTFRGEF